MLKSRALRSALMGTVLSTPFVATGFTQEIEINDAALAGKSAECRELAQLVKNRSEPTAGVSDEEIITAINDDNVENCVTYRTDVTSTDSQQQTESPSEKVDLSKDATIEGQAVVTVPEPNVDVQVPPASVRVVEQQQQIDITQEPAQIDLQQGRPRITVEIPEIIVRVDIPAPKLYMLQQDPQVQVSGADPQVEVVQGDPQISVSQADPNLSVNLGIDADQQDASTGTSGTSQQTASGQEQQVDGDVNVSRGQAQVEIVKAEGQPQMSYQSGEPSLNSENAEPDVSVMMPEQPKIEVQQTGDATVVIETPEQREQRRQQQPSNRAASEQPQSGQQVAQTEQQPTEQPQAEQPQTAQPQTAQTQTQPASAMSNAMMMTVGELMAMNVVTADGENLGAPEAFVNVNGEPNLVLGSGGFLGIGEKEVPVPMSRVSIQDNQLLIDGITENDIDAANDFEYNDDLQLSNDEQLQIGG